MSGQEAGFFSIFFWKIVGAEKEVAEHRLTPSYKALAEKPLFKAWVAEHDRIAAALATHRDPLSLP